MSEQMAWRNPNKRGKAHKRLGRWDVPVCQSHSLAGMRLFKTLTEEVRLSDVPPPSRCVRCFGAQGGRR